MKAQLIRFLECHIHHPGITRGQVRTRCCRCCHPPYHARHQIGSRLEIARSPRKPLPSSRPSILALLQKKTFSAPCPHSGRRTSRLGALSYSFCLHSVRLEAPPASTLKSPFFAANQSPSLTFLITFSLHSSRRREQGSIDLPNGMAPTDLPRVCPNCRRLSHFTYDDSSTSICCTACGYIDENATHSASDRGLHRFGRGYPGPGTMGH